jgi:hypothetical protein
MWLFRLQNENIKVEITAIFNGEDLVVEGYDIGKTVKEYWGDSDYEYSTTVRWEDLPKLYAALGVPPAQKRARLEALAAKFNTNSCYSEFCDFLMAHDIKSEGFSWR